MADISLLFDVAGGGNINGESGQKINNQLTAIIGQINANPFSIKVKLDQNSITQINNQLTNLRQNIERTFDLSTVNFNPSNINNVISLIGAQINNLLTGINNNGNNNGHSGGRRGGGGNNGNNLYNRFLDRYREMHSLLSSNTSFAATRAYEDLNVVLEEFENQLYTTNGNVRMLNNSISLSDDAANGYLDEATRQIRVFRAEIEDAGHSGVSLKKIYNLISSTRKTLHGTLGGSQATKIEIETEISQIESAVRDFERSVANNDPAASLENSFRAFGINGVESVRRVEEAVSRLKVESERDGLAPNSLGNLMKIAKSGRALLNSNTKASGLNNYQEFDRLISDFEENIDAARNAGLGLNRVLSNIPVSQIRSAADQMRSLEQEIEAAGLKGKAVIPKPAELLAGKTDELNAIFVRINRLKKRIEKDLSYTSAKHGKSKNEYKIIDGLVGDVEAFERDIGTFTKDGAINKIKALEKTLSDAEVVFDKNNEKSKTFADRIKTITKRFSEWFSVTHLITQAYQMLRRMVTAVVDIDSAMTELKKVTNETAARYDSFLRNAAVRAKNLGAALSDTVRATADFARLGYSIDEAEKMADAAIIYKNVGDGIQDINTASESIIATMQAFGVKANEVMTIVDKFNEVGNNFAVSSSGIGDALLRSAAAMHSAGNTIDETIALVAAANTIVQNPETVGGCSPNHTVMCV